MNNVLTQCPRCTGVAGAHFAFCFVAQAWERFMGPGYPWAPEPSDDPYCALHGRRFDPVVGCPDCLAEAEEPEWEEPYDTHGFLDLDPPDYQGVAEDTAVAMGAASDGDWLGPMHEHRTRVSAPAEAVPHGMWIAPEPAELHCEAVTELPPDYYDDKVTKPRTYNTEGLEKARQEALQAQEDAAVQFVYDCCEFTPGGRVLLADLHARFDEWRVTSSKPSMSKDRLRNLLVEVGLTVEPGRLPGMRTAGRAPLLVHGVTVRPVTVDVPETPKVLVLAKAKRRETGSTGDPSNARSASRRQRHALVGAKPGNELPRMIRDLIEPLVTEQGWEYQPHNGSGNGRPRVIAPDGKRVTLPATPHLNGRTLDNTKSFLKANGALL